ncbi:holin [Bacillus cereus]|nr:MULTISPECIES: CidA/LrgA family protein [Bacillus cereus group]MDA2239559.1 CidA/LrgA family protein [Bacillus cereus group sp. Bc222]ONG69017.1 holin [Bacillus cereus]PNS34197.1 holin [Bacillus sp. AKBS9]MCC2537485.1 CidA/LrgA family protein [Bacillus paranthracis]MCU5208242.1 CidA/LrgA family protein [Bacillus paranthracis]
MKYVMLLLQVGVLYVFSLVGTWIQGVFHLSMPGSLIGMLMLFLLLSIRILPLKWFEEATIGSVTMIVTGILISIFRPYGTKFIF